MQTRVGALVISCGALMAGAAEPNVVASRRAKADFALSADPGAPAWKGVAAVIADRDRRGALVPGHRTEIRSLWTPKHLYLLFVCPFEELYLKPDPTTTAETNKLWEWDVAEAFLGTDFKDIKKYKEYQVSPQGEWVDLEIDRENPKEQQGARWNSGYQVKGRVDEQAHIWYGMMRIPFAAIDTRPPEKNRELRIGLFRISGANPRQHHTWRATDGITFHVPKAFGTLRLR